MSATECDCALCEWDRLVGREPPRATCGECGTVVLHADAGRTRWCPSCRGRSREAWNARVSSLRGAYPAFGSVLLWRLASAGHDATSVRRMTDAEVLALRNVGPKRLREFRALVPDPSIPPCPNWVGEGVAA